MVKLGFKTQLNQENLTKRVSPVFISMHIIFGIIIIVIGALIIAKSEWMLSNFGRMGWFDQHLGSSGGSRMGYNIIGLIVVFFGILILTNMIGGFMNWLLAPIIRGRF